MRAALLVLPFVVVTSGCPAEEDRSFTLLQANVGNTLLSCQDGYIFKLCEVSVENAIRDRIAELRPDIIALQELLPSCEGIVEDDPRFVCHPDHTASEPSQLRRILPDGYGASCDTRNGYECVAVNFEAFDIFDYETLPPVESDADEECDPGFTVGFVGVSRSEDLSLTIANGHPQSGFIGACRKKQLEQVFREDKSFMLLTGDWNLDPFAAGEDPSVETWVAHVGTVEEGKRFRYHSGLAERNPPHPTTENALFTGVLDHVASDRFEGTCVTLGEADGTERLDGGEGTDHRALFCTLSP